MLVASSRWQAFDGMKKSDEISFSAFRPTDVDWFFDLHKLSLREYVEGIWGWDENWQRENFPKSLERGATSNIFIAGERAGRLTVSNQGNYIFLDYVALLPRYRNQGHGTKVIEIVQQRFPEKDIRLTVLRGNPVTGLYIRLGFEVESKDKIRTHMRRKVNHSAEQGARQPATAPDSKSEGNETPNPKSEGRSQ